MTHYETLRGEKPILKYFYEFDTTCFILNDKKQKINFDAKSD